MAQLNITPANSFCFESLGKYYPSILIPCDSPSKYYPSIIIIFNSPGKFQALVLITFDASVKITINPVKHSM